MVSSHCVYGRRYSVANFLNRLSRLAGHRVDRCTLEGRATSRLVDISLAGGRLKHIYNKAIRDDRTLARYDEHNYEVATHV